jgi:hypothetical protein
MPRGDHFKGQKPANSGRQKGSVNKTTLSVREQLSALWDERGLSDIRGSLEANPPEERAEIWSKVLKYFAPALSTQQVIQDKDAEPTTINVRFIEPNNQADGD